MSYHVRFTQHAIDDLECLNDFSIERELNQDGDFAIGERALDAIRNAIAMLSFSPFTCRKAADDPFVRELVIPFGGSGYVALFEIDASDSVVIAAVRHQREDDFY